MSKAYVMENFSMVMSALCRSNGPIRSHGVRINESSPSAQSLLMEVESMQTMMSYQPRFNFRSSSGTCERLPEDRETLLTVGDTATINLWYSDVVHTDSLR